MNSSPTHGNGTDIDPVVALQSLKEAIESLPQIDSDALSFAHIALDIDAQPIGDDDTMYQKAVAEAKQIINQVKSHQMRLGSLADQVLKQYDTDQLGQFADEIGIERNTLERYRSVYRAWKDSGSGAGISYSVAKELEAVPNKEEIVAANANLTNSQAHAIAKAHRQRMRNANTDWSLPETKRWFKDLTERISKAIYSAQASRR